MTKQKLKFKIEGGLNKLSELYTATDKDSTATDTYWENPSALLEALSVAPSKEIRISQGYRKLAETMGGINFEELRGSFDYTRTDDGVQAKPLTTILSAVAGVAPEVIRAGGLKDDFGKEGFNTISISISISMTMTMTMTIMMTMVSTSTSTVSFGYEDKKKPPGGPKFSACEMAAMSRYAQTVADHISLFS